MIEPSKGIPGDIDLTMDRAFRKGVRPLVVENRITPGQLPWDSSGKKRTQSKRSVSDGDLNSDSVGLNIISIENGFDLTVTSTVNDILDQLVVYHYQDSDVDLRLVESNVIDRFEQTSDVRLLDALPGALSIRGGRLMYNSVDNTGHNRYNIDTWTDGYGEYSSTSTGYAAGKYLSVTWTDGYTDITPFVYGITRLTNSEMNGGMITGHADEVADKIALRDFVNRIRPLISNRTRHTTNMIPKGVASTNVKSCTKDLLYRLKSSETMMSIGPTEYSTFKHFNDQSRWYTRRDDKTIDFFFQRVCEDRGLCLIRRRRNSHELRVDLESREFIEEADMPIAHDKRLTYEKNHLVEDGTTDRRSHMLSVSTDTGVVDVLDDL